MSVIARLACKGDVSAPPVDRYERDGGEERVRVRVAQLVLPLLLTTSSLRRGLLSLARLLPLPRLGFDDPCCAETLRLRVVREVQRVVLGRMRHVGVIARRRQGRQGAWRVGCRRGAGGQTRYASKSEERRLRGEGAAACRVRNAEATLQVTA